MAFFFSLALSGADADDPVHQLALGLLFLQVVVLSDAVDELADLIGLARERRVRGALGQLVDLVQGVELQQLLRDKRVNVCAGVAQVIQVIVLARQQAGVADWPLALPLAGGTGSFGGSNLILYCLTIDAYIMVSEAVACRQLGNFA